MRTGVATFSGIRVAKYAFADARDPDPRAAWLADAARDQDGDTVNTTDGDAASAALATSVATRTSIAALRRGEPLTNPDHRATAGGV